MASGEGAILPGDTGVWVTCARHQEGKAAREVGVLFAEVCGFSSSFVYAVLSCPFLYVWCLVLWVLWLLWLVWFLWCWCCCVVPVPHPYYYACQEWLLMR